MPVRLMITFPYSAKSADVFLKLSQVLVAAGDGKLLHTSKELPLLVINKDSLENYEEFVKQYPQLAKKHAPHYVWAVDTCQMWLAGWGKILDDNRDPNRTSPPDLGIIQVPGDLTQITSRDFNADPVKDFITHLTTMRLWLGDGQGVDKVHFILGDFEVAPQKAKQLIDTYGTFPLLYNWFPEVAEKLRELRIDRPRSEFFAASTEFLETLTTKPLRKFAYEQTLVLLIHAIRAGTWRIEREDIGIIEDYGGDRGFKEATNQIERTERVLKLLWRETNSTGNQGFPSNDFERLDERSTAIRRNAMICCKNILDPAGP